MGLRAAWWACSSWVSSRLFAHSSLAVNCFSPDSRHRTLHAPRRGQGSRSCPCDYEHHGLCTDPRPAQARGCRRDATPRSRRSAMSEQVQRGVHPATSASGRGPAQPAAHGQRSLRAAASPALDGLRARAHPPDPVSEGRPADAVRPAAAQGVDRAAERGAASLSAKASATRAASSWRGVKRA